ncbi:hypothetical protein PISL3812_00779 [Talaromyces islandicus]|uniref:Uncharacterized protein n=1 Tax=Talaromyces islandicus TaxID=28573 RepID=A0A0U1LKA0_TALIS|nr:hypothetical protein PISL3812_00779 [Talaromyces islandicus]
MPLFRLNPFRSLNGHEPAMTRPSITCEKCNHKQPQKTSSDAVMASLIVLFSYFLAFLDDIELQLNTICGWEKGLVFCLLSGALLLGFFGVAFWVGAMMLPWVIGCWVIWVYVRCGFDKAVVSLAESHGATEMAK